MHSFQRIFCLGLVLLGTVSCYVTCYRSDSTVGCAFWYLCSNCWLSDAGEVLPSFVLSQCSDALHVLRCILVHGARHCPLSMDHQPADCYGRPAGVRYT